MTEEEYFRKNYPDSCYGDRLLSPYWDYFQDGVEFGERQSEKKIEDLEEENKDLRDNYDQFKAVAEPEIERLQKENAELKDALKGKRCNCMTYLNFKDLEKELTKAEEIIKGLLSCCRNYPQENAEKMEQAEQFIKEIEK
ncbi:MAG: hypothetical protein J6S85_23965 [Methanobrevibacter sp.]|nr:hypothetical protein [Methanobrevibacter sp.]